ncbi:hypothetical protein [Kocuria arenosa]|uniref:hypothetical protein n=1 Tax=Kocuria arenosa TaxID=3071446 RepID=UPI0034D3DCFE
MIAVIITDLFLEHVHVLPHSDRVGKKMSRITETFSEPKSRTSKQEGQAARKIGFGVLSALALALAPFAPLPAHAASNDAICYETAGAGGWAPRVCNNEAVFYPYAAATADKGLTAFNVTEAVPRSGNRPEVADVSYTGWFNTARESNKNGGSVGVPGANSVTAVAITLSPGPSNAGWHVCYKVADAAGTVYRGRNGTMAGENLATSLPLVMMQVTVQTQTCPT